MSAKEVMERAGNTLTFLTNNAGIIPLSDTIANEVCDLIRTLLAELQAAERSVDRF
jgi:hypothetical protein